MTRRSVSITTALLLGAGLIVAAPPGASAGPSDSRAVVAGNARFEVLSPTLIRTEYAEDGHFEDRATFNAVGRDGFPVTAFTSNSSHGWLTIRTSAMTLRYRLGSGTFKTSNLRTTVRNGHQLVQATPWASTVPPTCAPGTRCEAEDLTLAGVGTATDHTGYTGNGFAAGFQQTGNSLTFTTTVPTSGDYDVAARYANSQGGDGKKETRTLSVSADGGEPATLTLPTTADWDTWSVVRAPLHLDAGTHTISLSRTASDSGNVNVDNVAVLTPGAAYPEATAPVATDCAFRTVCEAEAGTLTGGAKLAGDHNGHSGPGFVGGLEQTGASDAITVTGVPEAGDYRLQLRYANASGQSRAITVNGDQVALAPTSSWNAWRIQSVPVHLSAGTDTVTLACPTDDSCHVNLDTVAIAPSADPVLAPHAPLGGYRRSLDGVDGGAPTTPGLLYQDGWSLLDDTASGVYDASTHDVSPRSVDPSYRDGYVFGYGQTYDRGLSDLKTLTGPAKLLPRWAYGLWYSEYYDRTADQFENTILPAFRSHGVPLDVLVTDTDFKVPNTWNGWEVDPSKFPDPKAFNAWAHAQGLHTSLNIHPSIDGTDPHYAHAQKIAHGKLRPGGCGAGSDCHVFDFGDPDQLAAYFWLHDAMKATGNDLWWLDWCCDSTTSSKQGVTGDAWINRAYADYTAKRLPRGFAFSRAYGSLDGGYGNNNGSLTGPWADKRTTLHFTGDTVSDWQTLAFEVGYTPGESAATGLPSVSHDIGGHFGGDQTTGSEPGSTKLADDLYARWVQLGTFQPIDRLHSNHSDRLPWQYGAAAEQSAEKFLNLRENLVPYTYSLAQQATATGMPIVRPLYLQYPDQQEAYAQADAEYLYGPDVLVAPVTSPGTSSSTTVWFPAGDDWTDWFTGKTYRGGTAAQVDTTLGSMPVFTRAGGIVVTRSDDVDNDVQHKLTDATVTVTQGAPGSFQLYEDDGVSSSARHASTAITTKHDTVRVAGTVGSFAGQPARRTWTVVFAGATQPRRVRADGAVLPADAWTWNAGTHTLTVHTPTRGIHDPLSVSYQ